MTTPQEDRIIRAKTAVEAYGALTGGSFRELFTDLLADLMHYADWLPTDAHVVFDDVLRTARDHHHHEKAEDE